MMLTAGCSRQQPPPDVRSLRPSSPAALQPWFEEAAAVAGVNSTYQTGHRGRFFMPEIKGGGVGLLDYDRDGLLDLFFVQAGSLHPGETNRPGHRLFRNLGAWRFEEVTRAAGVWGRGSYGMGCACADYDGDGYTDLLVTYVDGVQLFRNRTDGTFQEVTREAGLTDRSWGVSAAFCDYDADGHLDLVIANYLRWSIESEVECYSQGGLPDYCSPLSYQAPAVDTLYHNRGDGTFELVTAEAGLNQAYGNGLGVVVADFNRDGRLDLFVANDASPNQLWINLGGGRFRDEALLRGCAVNSLGMPEAGMGVTTADLNDDGWRDLFITHLVGEANRLFMNTNGYFTDTVQPKGPGAPSWPQTSFGVGFFDFDLDGFLDLYVSNGRVKRAAQDLDPSDPYAEPDVLLRGKGQGEFEQIPMAGLAASRLASGRGAAFGDLDNDGDVDVVVANRDRPAFLLRNVVARQGHWIALRLVDRRGRDAVGAEARIEAGARIWWRAVAPHESYASSNDPRVHCGLGTFTEVSRVLVRWIGGPEEVFGPLSVDAEHRLQQGTGMTLP